MKKKVVRYIASTIMVSNCVRRPNLHYVWELAGFVHCDNLSEGEAVYSVTRTHTRTQTQHSQTCTANVGRNVNVAALKRREGGSLEGWRGNARLH